ncbi:hypothetical protein [Streptomyces uncialis]|uniref:hypothetical protein n=1 Tax=Streptomyces uncialis TaxID=1048205 RepID=UPI000AE7C234|nr:hypothetical protein [Streptomyces uncialis]
MSTDDELLDLVATLGAQVEVSQAEILPAATREAAGVRAEESAAKLSDDKKNISGA